MNLSKNPTNTICVEAVIALLRDGTPIRETIHECKDVTKFVTVRTVSGGAKQDDEYLGKAIRWYYGTGGSQINYSKRKAKVAKSDGSKPLMELPDELPADINYAWYVAEAQAMLCDIGYGQATLF